MAYFVTGGTGFIGRFLIGNLLKRGDPIYVLVRKGSQKKLAALREEWGASEAQVIAVVGDLAQAAARRGRRRDREAQGQGQAHVPSRRDLRPVGERRGAGASPTSTARGTRSSSPTAVQAGCFHHVSSIAAAGLYEGTFREDMFEEAEELDHPYFKTKHDSEGIVRNECKRPWRVYRPGFVVGHSQDRLHRQDRRPVLLLQADPEDAQDAAGVGADDRHRGRAHQHRAGRLRRRRARPSRAQEGARRQVLPSDRPGPAPHRRGAQHLRQGGARAADDDAHQRAHVRLHSRADPLRHRVAGAGQADDPRGAEGPRHSEGHVPVRQLADALRQSRGDEGAQGLRHRGARTSRPTRRRCGTTGSATSIRISSSTAACRGRVTDKVVVVTGASSGIGRATALKLAAAGAKVMLVARGEEKLVETKKEIEAAGGKAWIYTCDVSDMASCDALVAKVLKDHGACDYLVNNAGRSIRRGIAQLARPLPRLRAHDAAQLFRSAAADHGLPAGAWWRAEARPHHQHLVDRRADQRAALLGLRRVEGGAGRVLRLRRVRVSRQGHQLHDDQHAAGAHADDRADQDVRERADALAGGGGRSRRRGDRLQAGAHRHAARRLRRGARTRSRPSSRRSCSTRRSTCSRTRPPPRARRKARRSRSARSRWRSRS